MEHNNVTVKIITYTDKLKVEGISQNIEQKGKGTGNMRKNEGQVEWTQMG